MDVSWSMKKAESRRIDAFFFFFFELMLLNCELEKCLDSPLDFKEIKSVNPKGNQS